MTEDYTYTVVEKDKYSHTSRVSRIKNVIIFDELIIAMNSSGSMSYQSQSSTKKIFFVIGNGGENYYVFNSFSTYLIKCLW